MTTEAGSQNLPVRFLFRPRTWAALAMVHAILLIVYFWARASDVPIRLARAGQTWTLQVAGEKPQQFQAGDLHFDRASLWVGEDHSYTQLWNEGGWSLLTIRTPERAVFENQLVWFAGGPWKVNWRGELVAARPRPKHEKVQPAEAPIDLKGDFTLVAQARRARLASLSLHQDNPPATVQLDLRVLQKDYECVLKGANDSQQLASKQLGPMSLYYFKELLWKLLSIYFSGIVLAGIVLAIGLLLRLLPGGAPADGAEQEALPRGPRLRTVLAYAGCLTLAAGAAAGVLLLVVVRQKGLGSIELMRQVRGDFGMALCVLFLLIVFGALFALALRVLSSVGARVFAATLRVMPPDGLTVGLICVSVFLITAAGAKYLMKETPHVQDSAVYLMQGKMLAAGRLWAPIPKAPEFFEFTFLRLELRTGRWFGTYVPGHPAMLALGVWAGRPWLVAPLMAALTTLIFYLTARMVYGTTAGLAAAALALVSPWFLFVSTSMMSHPTALFFVSLFIYLALRAERGGHWAIALGSGLSLGMAAITRPMSAAAAGLAVALYWLVALFRQRRLWRRGALIAVGVAPMLCVLMAYNWELTGDPLRTPMALDSRGASLVSVEHFSVGAWLSIMEVNLAMLLAQLFGWPGFSLALVVAALIWARRKETWLLAGIALGMVAGYSPIRYYFHLFGPRFWYEGLLSVLVLSGAGLSALGRLGVAATGQFVRGRDDRRGPAPWLTAVCCVIFVLVLYNVTVFAPMFLPRLNSYNGITGRETALLRDRQLDGALVFSECLKSPDWQDYGRVVWMNDPILERGRLIAARDLGPKRNARLAFLYPGRKTYRLTMADPPVLEEADYLPPVREESQAVERQMLITCPVLLVKPKGIAVSRGGEVFVLDYERSRVVRFDAAGTFLGAWGRKGRGRGEFQDASGIAVGQDDTVYILDGWNKRVSRFAPDGRFLGQIDVDLFGARGIAVAGRGELYVADTGNAAVKMFGSPGVYRGRFGAPGDELGKMKEPVGIAVGPAGEVFVCDTGNRRVQVFDKDGQPLRAWPVELWDKYPQEGYIAVDADGVTWITDAGNHQVVRYDAHGHLLGKLTGARPNESFEEPAGIAVDTARNRVYVTNMLGRYVSVFPWKAASEPAATEN